MRQPNETYQQAYARLGPLTAGAADAGGEAGAEGGSDNAFAHQVPFAKADFSVVPDWNTQATATAGFDHIRDPRFISTPVMLRRETWLYPDDGCFARAALAGQRLAAAGYKRPWKLFAFGNFVVHSANAASIFLSVDGGPPIQAGCTVQWWYHVVPVIRVGQDVLVLDPAVDPFRPLPVQTWILRLVPSTSDVVVSICGPYTYDPWGSCLHSTPADESHALSDEEHFLAPEWQRQGDLDRNPTQALGTEPPWRSGNWGPDGGLCGAPAY